MSRIAAAPGEYYHVYNRGTEKRDIFLTDQDYRRFMSLLYLCNDTNGIVDVKLQGKTLPEVLKVKRGVPFVSICAYCLMPNHFHLLVQEQEPYGLGKFMQKLTTGYTMYFNKRNDRTGALFQGKYKLKHADDDTYLRHLISYIHLNPVKLIEPQWKEAGIVRKIEAERFLHKYPYSSFHEFAGIKRPESVIADPLSLPDYFETPRGFKETLAAWLQGPTL